MDVLILLPKQAVFLNFCLKNPLKCKGHHFVILYASIVFFY